MTHRELARRMIELCKYSRDNMGDVMQKGEADERVVEYHYSNLKRIMLRGQKTMKQNKEDGHARITKP